MNTICYFYIDILIINIAQPDISFHQEEINSNKKIENNNALKLD